MLTNLLIVLPIFALILVGWIARKAGALGPNATREVNRLVVYLALPALLFDIMANANIDEIWQPGFTTAFTVGCAVVFASTVAWRMVSGLRLADAVIDGLNASYANTGFVGFPLTLALLGKSGMGSTLLATIITACMLFAIAITLIEAGLQSKTRRRDIVINTGSALARNPLVLAPVLGAAVLLCGWHLPTPLHTFLKLLGGAAAPCALIALGLFLAGMQISSVPENVSTIGILVVLKLIAQPAITWIVAAPLMQLPPLTVQAAVLLSALPTGTGPFMLAELHNREATTTGRVVLLSTICSILTLSFIIALMR